MSTVTVRPNETVAGGGSSPVGAATQHEATNDDSDSSYIALAGANSTLGFGEPVIPAGGVVTDVRIRVRVAVALTTASYRISAGDEGATRSVSWVSPTTVTAATWPADAFELADVELAIEKTAGSGELRVHELYIDFIYAVELTVDVFGAFGAFVYTETNLPLMFWERTFDEAGGSPTHFEVKVFTDAVVEGGGFDPDTSSSVESSGIVASGESTYELDDGLPNDDYHTYVRVAQTINGEQVWSDWDSDTFAILTDAPGEPTIALVPQHACGRMRIEITQAAIEDVASERYQIQRSDDGGTTWADIRTVDGGGSVDDTASPTIALDWEVGNGATVRYRVRSIHDYTETDFSVSDWVESADDDWASSVAWLKHPHDPTLNMAIDVYAMPSWRRAARQSVQQPLGRSDSVVVSDTRGPETGEITLQQDTAALQAAFDELLDTGSPLLLQLPAGKHFDDAWIVFADHERTRMVDKLDVEETLDTLPATKVGRPSGNLVAWPDFTCP